MMLKKPEKLKLTIGAKRKIKPKTRASIKFASGPAKPTFASPYFLSRKLKGLYGTGLAQAKIKEVPDKTIIKGKKNEPIQSRCFKGLKVKRPAFFAVKSPNL